MKHGRMMKYLALLALAVLLLLTSCGGGTKATTMHLQKTEGTVDVSDNKGKELEPMENLGLYSGYGVDTQSESYAWIDLDEVKLTKMDQDSEIEIKKEDNHLEIQVLSGSLFFNVTEPLAEDEAMEIRTSNMMVGIRGTCGWVALSEDKGQLSVYLLEGKVRCEADGGQETVRAGEMAIMTGDGEITVTEFSAWDIPAFVTEEIEDDDDLVEAILDDSGIDVAGAADSPLNAYKEVLAEREKEGEVLYTEMVDFEADGNPELLVLHTRDNDNESELFAVSVYRTGPNGVDDLYFGTPQLGDRGTFSLVESDGRLYMETYQLTETHDDGVDDYMYRYAYDGSIAEKDGDRPSWSGDDRDWTMIYWLSHIESTNHGASYKKLFDLYDQYGSNIITAEEFEEIHGKFSMVKVLAYSPDGESLIITPDPSDVEDIPAPEPDILPTDGDRTVLTGTVGTYSYDEVLTLQGVADPNAGYSDTSQIFLLIVLDTPQVMTARSGDGLDSYESEATMIDITGAAGLEQYDGQHIVFSIDPNETWWPSDTSLPLGEPSTGSVHVLE